MRTATYRLDSKTARLKLEPRRKPYYTQVSPGVTLGYTRSAKGAGAWQVRRLVAGAYRYETIAAADDLGLPNGKTILSHAQAVQAAHATQGSSALTVKDALDRYIAALNTKYQHWTRLRADNEIIPTLGSIRVDRLTRQQIEDWRAARTKSDPKDHDKKRRSQDTVNRLMSVLRAALNAAFRDEANGLRSDAAWRTVRQYRDVGRPRDVLLTVDQVRDVISAAATFDKHLAALVAAGYLTGARIGELVALDVRDLDARRNTLHIRMGKTGPRICLLTAEATALLEQCAHKRKPDAPLLLSGNGGRWVRNGQRYPFRRAAAMAGLPAGATYYSLRHSHISESVLANAPLPVLAANVGTSVRMIEKTYFKAAAAQRRHLIEATAPRLGNSVRVR